MERWTVDRPEVRVDLIPIPPLPFEGARIQRERITKQDIDEFGATIGCRNQRQQKSTGTLNATYRMRIEERLRTTPHGAERLDRRNEVINEALEEGVREESRGSRGATKPQQECLNQNQQHQNREKTRLNQKRIRRGDCS